VADILERLAALREFRSSDDFLALAAASKRVGNILDQAETRGEPTRPDQEAGALAGPAELALAEAVKGTAGTTDALLAARDYRGALAAIAALRGPVDRFFDDVLVMDPDARVRHARLGLLAGIRRLARAVVDMSLIVVEGAEKN
jgi:glycyl-tRNA synthetase beta chain